ncbi:MAG: hypothetical protein L3J32_10820 [Rhizobiaceae bacterium]|nr:hypothetical protein [Rhizobiaceae bacterium]
MLSKFFKNQIRQLFFVLPYLVLFSGIIATGIGWFLLSNIGDINRNSEEKLVRVTDIFIEKSTNGIVCKPQFALILGNGNEIQFSGSEGMWPCPHREGEIVLAKYLKSTGEIVSNYMLKQKSWWGMSILQMGFVNITFGGFWWFMRRKVRRLQSKIESKF